jgi:hypothetical protein
MARPRALMGRLSNNFLSQSIGYGIGSGIQPAVEPFVQEWINKAWSLRPTRPLPAADAAEAVVRSLFTFEEAEAEAKLTGVNSDRFKILHGLAGNPPGPQEIIELWNRGELTPEQVTQALRQSRLRPEYFEAYKAFRHRLMPPESLAGLVARGLADSEDAASESAQQGIDGAHFARMVDGALRPPGTGEMLDLLNRGHTSEGEVMAALKRAGLHPDWVAEIIKLRGYLPSPTDLIRFAVREVFTPAIAQRFGLADDFPPAFATQAARLGISPEVAHWFWMAHWELPSPEMGFRMLHRDIIKRPDLELLLRALDVMPFWRGKLIDLAYLVPGRIDLRRMYEHGIIQRPRVLRGYLDIGYSPENAETLTDFAVALKLAPERDLAKAEILSAYIEGEWTRAETLDALEHFGYEQDEAAILLALANARANRALTTQTMSIVRARFKEREITEAEARDWLSKVIPSPDAVDKRIELWEFERDENPRRLTEAQARAVWKKKIRDEAWYRSYLELLGYAEDERDLMVAIYG